ncbi:Citrate synthase, partial [Sesbania bispinosa]
MRGKKEGGGERALRPRARGTTIAAGTRTRQREMEARTCWWRSSREAEEGRAARMTAVGAFLRLQWGFARWCPRLAAQLGQGEQWLRGKNLDSVSGYLNLLFCFRFWTSLFYFDMDCGGCGGSIHNLLRGMSIPECLKALPGAFPGGEPLPEAVMWLLSTGKIPSKEQVDSLAQELRNRATIPDYAYKAIDALPVSAHPMTQFTTGVMALQ